MPAGFCKRQQSANSQDFYQLRQQCLEAKVLFGDPQFECTDDHEWLRPSEICENPRFFIEGTSRFDVRQGELADCWLVAALANLAENEKLFEMVVHDDNSFSENYAGIFHFRFWQHGQWVDVVIDDRLPTKNKQLMFMHSTNSSEFWSALLEKAYAKLCGGYDALNGGSTSEALVDFTGGVAETFILNSASQDLFEVIQKAFEKQSMIGCSIDQVGEIVEEQTPEGLVRGHAYSISKAVSVDTPPFGKVQLLRLRNPWGNHVEWNGAWSDESQEWKNVSDEVKESLEVSFNHDGEFWMTYDDFLKNFDRMDICSLSPDLLIGLNDIEKKWNVNVFEGAWVAGVSAGGCRNHPDTYHRNPQFVLTIEKPANDDTESCTVVVALMQKHRRLKRSSGSNRLYLGFTIFELQDCDLAEKPKKQEFFKQNRPKFWTPTHQGKREVTGRFELTPGHYLIVPSTFKPDKNAEFLIRVFTESRQTFEENDCSVAIEEPEILVPDAQNNSICAKLFENHVDSNEEIGWKELQQILNDLLVEEEDAKIFSENLCRSMVAMLDVDYSGKLSIDEFQVLFFEIAMWKDAFKLYDKDNSGGLDVSELRDAFASVGYQINNRILNALAYRYGSDDRSISLEDFILCAVKVKTMLEHFKKRDIGNKNAAIFTSDEWIISSIYS